MPQCKLFAVKYLLSSAEIQCNLPPTLILSFAGNATKKTKEMTYTQSLGTFHYLSTNSGLPHLS